MKQGGEQPARPIDEPSTTSRTAPSGGEEVERAILFGGGASGGIRTQRRAASPSEVVKVNGL
jgi:hypothetical protein